MTRAIWKGSVTFGLIHIPVELHGAVRDHRPRFRMLHAKDKSPIKYDHVCQQEGRPVSWAELVKGYEYEKGKFVVLTKEDFQTAALEKSRTIDVLDFVPAKEVDDRYFETPYYLVPGKGGERGYALLREALRGSDKLGVAKIILREAQHLVALTTVGDALVLTTMRFADELADVGQLKMPAAEGVRERDLEMAKALVEGLSSRFDPAKYTDEYRDNLMRIIQGKLKGKRPALSEGESGQQQGEIVDLMERLRLSLQTLPAAKGGAAPGAAAHQATAKKAVAAGPKKLGGAKRSGAGVKRAREGRTAA